MNTFSYKLIYVKITNKCILAISKMFVPTLRNSIIWNLGGGGMQGNYFIGMTQMSELAVTFWGMELPEFPPVKSNESGKCSALDRSTLHLATLNSQFYGI